MGFAQNLKYIKEQLGLSNYRLAKLFGCSQSSLLNWLDNGVIPHKKTRQKIADHFGITLADLDGDELLVGEGRQIDLFFAHLRRAPVEQVPRYGTMSDVGTIYRPYLVVQWFKQSFGMTGGRWRL